MCLAGCLAGRLPLLARGQNSVRNNTKHPRAEEWSSVHSRGFASVVADERILLLFSLAKSHTRKYCSLEEKGRRKLQSSSSPILNRRWRMVGKREENMWLVDADRLHSHPL